MDQGLRRHLKESGIIATLPGSLPLPLVTMVADALLAAPVLAVEVVLSGGDTAVIQDLCRRAGHLMMVGARIQAATQAAPALAAGSRFITTLQWDTAVWQQCEALQVDYLPGVMSGLAAQEVAARGCRWFRLRTGGGNGADYTAAVRQTVPQAGLAADADISPQNLAAYSRAGADAVFAGPAIFTGPGQTMADIIIRARELQQAWDQ